MTVDFRVGDWEIHPSKGTLESGDQQAQLEPKVMDLLVYLAENSDEVLSKERLIDAVWPDAFVADDVLTSAIWKLRQALGDDPKDPAYIKTFPRRGYQLVAEVDLPEEFPGERGAVILEISPYPGLEAFTADQSTYFFGREAEIEAIWEKLHRSHLLGLIGPSGGGKSSFLRAGVLPSAPSGWVTVLATPGTRPFLSLAQALSGELAGEAEEMKQLLRFEEPEVALPLVTKWRSRHEEVLIVVDQFEELFTLNPEEIQENFSGLLGRLVHEAGVHLLLSMRDDFLIRCHGLKALEQVFAADLTPIRPPVGSALKRALVEPAASCGYEFENESLVEEMLEAVACERGTLPLLAFTAAELWKRRDRERKLLTKKAYEEIGGLEGALAGHAEATLDRIGSEGLPVVRELFRNLVTAQNTRSVQSKDELLSVFEAGLRAEAGETLSTLIDARLLVSYRQPSIDTKEEVQDRVEIVHESLLKNWPRLVRWQAQDVEGAQLRDELRQTARIWDQRGRPEALLWGGTAVREFQLWRERYPGGLSDLEEAFGKAMLLRARRRVRSRRLAVMAVVVFSLAAMAVFFALWRQADAERLRAEGAVLLAFAQDLEESHPTAAAAYATKSLELADSEAARLFVTDVLTQGPIAFTREVEYDGDLLFSPGGRALHLNSAHQRFNAIVHSDGSADQHLDEWDIHPWVNFSRDGRYLWMGERLGERPEFRIWRFPELTKVKEFRIDRELDSGGYNTRRGHPDGLVFFERIGETSEARGQLIPFEGEEVKDLGIWPWEAPGTWQDFHFGPKSSRMVKHVDGELFVVDGLPDNPTPPRKFGEGGGWMYTLPDWKRFLVMNSQPSPDGTYETRVWNLDAGAESRPRTFHPSFPGDNKWGFDKRGEWFAQAIGSEKLAAVWDLTGPVSAGPQFLMRGNQNTPFVGVHPDGTWVAVADTGFVSLWPLRRSYPSTLLNQEFMYLGLAVDPNGKFAVAGTAIGGNNLFLLSLETLGDARPRILMEGPAFVGATVSPDGKRVAAGSWGGNIFLVSVSDGTTEQLSGFGSFTHQLEFDSNGTRLAAAGGLSRAEDAVIRVWDLATGDVQVLDDGQVSMEIGFGPDGRLYSSGGGGFKFWDISSGDSEVLIPGVVGRLSPDGRYFLGGSVMDFWEEVMEVSVFDLETGEVRSLASHGKGLGRTRWHPSGEAVLTIALDGLIQIGPVTGEPPHRFPGHYGRNTDGRFHPNGQWIITNGEDGTVRLWPMPDLSKPAFHTLPYDELMTRLKSLTNYRVVKDESEPTGYRIEYGEFPDWEKGVPEW